MDKQRAGIFLGETKEYTARVVENIDKMDAKLKTIREAITSGRALDMGETRTLASMLDALASNDGRW
jgi:hypothetical protein